MSRKQKDKGKSKGKEVAEVDDYVVIQDSVYKYNEEKIAKQWKEKPWKKDAKYFKKVRISVLAATKMVKHAVQGVNRGRKQGGLPIEVMGLMIGRPDDDVLIVMDALELPVEGSETRVVADDEKVLGFMTRMQDRIESLRKDRFIGWYHSHPFDVGVHSNAFFSATDVNTQLMWQLQFGKWVGVVIDPLRCLSKQKVDLLPFMAYPPTYDPPKNQGPDGNTDNNIENLRNRWGAAYNRYYMLQHSFFMGSLVKHNLEMMSRKHLWIRHLSSNALLETENRSELPKRIQTLTKTASQAQTGRRGPRKTEESLQETVNLGRDIAIEQCVGHASQLLKSEIFNTTVSESG